VLLATEKKSNAERHQAMESEVAKQQGRTRKAEREAPLCDHSHILQRPYFDGTKKILGAGSDAH